MMEFIFSSSLLIVLVILIRGIFRRRIPAWVCYSLWLLVAVRLLLPVPLFESPFSTWQFSGWQTSGQNAEQMEGTGEPIIAPSEEFVSGQPDGNNIITGEQETSHKKSGLSDMFGRQILLTIWVCGSVLLGLYFLMVKQKFDRKMRENRTEFGSPGQYPLPVFLVKGLSSPCLYGILKPAVYLTPETLEEEERTECVFAHEYAHYRQKDHIWSFLRLVCLTLYWWNPFVWLAALLSRKDGELSCDERVVRMLGEEKRIVYGRTLLTLMEAPVYPENSLFGAASLVGRKGELRERITRIAEKPVKLSTVAALLVLVFAGTAVCLTFGGRAKNGDGEIYQAGMTGNNGMKTADVIFQPKREMANDYGLDYRDVRDILLSVTLPEGWYFGEKRLDFLPVSLPEGLYYGEERLDFLPLKILWSETGIYNEKDECVGAVGYNLYQEQEGVETLPQAIYSQIALGNGYHFSAREEDGYTPVTTSETGETAVTTVYYAGYVREGMGFPKEEKENLGILSYDRELHAYVAFEFDRDAVSEDVLKQIAESVTLAGGDPIE